MINRLLRPLLIAAAALALACAPGLAAGSLPVALQQVVDSNGKPIVGAKLYTYQVGTVATQQTMYSDTGLTVPLSWPLLTDSNGRFPMFYLADGSVGVRLTDTSGGTLFYYPSMLVIGPSGGGGGGSSVDPTTIAQTGDVKWRPTNEVISGWVKLNGTTIGSATSGATGRANADTQTLFVWLYTNCSDTKCPVSGGRTGNAANDYSSNKTITTPKYQGRMLAGLDDMGGTAQNIVQALNVTSGGGDGPTTPGAWGGEAVHYITNPQLPVTQLTFTGTPVTPTFTGTNSFLTNLILGANYQGGASGQAATSYNAATNAGTISQITPAGTISSFGGGNAMNVMSSFVLGTWYMKL